MSVFVITLTVVALLSSGYFILTWGWGITRAKRRGQPHLTWVGILDYAGLQGLVFAYTALAMYSFVHEGVPPITSWDMLVRRVLLYILLVVVAGIRTARWLLRQNPRWARPLISAMDRFWHWRAVRRMRRQRRKDGATLGA